MPIHIPRTMIEEVPELVNHLDEVKTDEAGEGFTWWANDCLRTAWRKAYHQTYSAYDLQGLIENSLRGDTGYDPVLIDSFFDVADACLDETDDFTNQTQERGETS